MFGSKLQPVTGCSAVAGEGRGNVLHALTLRLEGQVQTAGGRDGRVKEEETADTPTAQRLSGLSVHKWGSPGPPLPSAACGGG